MKLRNHQFSTQPRIFEGGGYEHPWYKHLSKPPTNEYEDKISVKNSTVRNIGHKIIMKPNPPSKEAIEKAKFVDKTYHWSGDNRIRSGNKRASK